MLTMIGLALEIADDPALQAGEGGAEHERHGERARKPQRQARLKTIVVAPSVAPRANDMMLPESVMKVMPMATQPMKEIVVISDTRLTFERKPGVPSANAANAASAATRIASSVRFRRVAGNDRRRPICAVKMFTPAPPFLACRF